LLKIARLSKLNTFASVYHPSGTSVSLETSWADSGRAEVEHAPFSGSSFDKGCGTGCKEVSTVSVDFSGLEYCRLRKQRENMNKLKEISNPSVDIVVA
jgi:hypothetical protein